MHPETTVDTCDPRHLLMRFFGLDP